jgi:hypothetical protein
VQAAHEIEVRGVVSERPHGHLRGVDTAEVLCEQGRRAHVGEPRVRMASAEVHHRGRDRRDVRGMGPGSTPAQHETGRLGREPFGDRDVGVERHDAIVDAGEELGQPRCVDLHRVAHGGLVQDVLAGDRAAEHVGRGRPVAHPEEVVGELEHRSQPVAAPHAYDRLDLGRARHLDEQQVCGERRPREPRVERIRRADGPPAHLQQLRERVDVLDPQTDVLAAQVGRVQYQESRHREVRPSGARRPRSSRSDVDDRP